MPGQVQRHTIDSRSSGLPPNMPDYEGARRHFSWAAARAEFAGLPGGGLNIAHEAVDRHAGGPLAPSTALRFLGRHGGKREITYAELKLESDRCANLLGALGLKRGERVFVLVGRIAELDFLNVVVAVHGQSGVEISERDYQKLPTLEDAAADLLAARPGSPGMDA